MPRRASFLSILLVLAMTAAALTPWAAAASGGLALVTSSQEATSQTVGFTGVTVATGVGAGVTVMLAVPPTGCSSCSPVREENRNQPESPMAARQRARTM